MVTVSTYQTLNEAASALGEGVRYLAGGTITMRAVNFGDQSFHHLVRVAQPERGVSADSQGLRIGAATTMADVLKSAELSHLHAVARSIGGPAVRNMATVGGNLFAQNPYGDMTVALMALDAQVVLSGGHSQPIDSFVMDRAHTRNLVMAVVIPRIEHGSFYYSKVSRVKPRGVSVMTISAWLRRGDPRVVFGNMAAVPTRARAAERELAGGLSPQTIQAACALCTEGLQPVDDALATAWYRREVAPVHMRRMLENGGTL